MNGVYTPEFFSLEKHGREPHGGAFGFHGCSSAFNVDRAECLPQRPSRFRYASDSGESRFAP
jgi:hypothetical protein